MQIYLHQDFVVFQVNDLLDRLPGTGAFKHGPQYIYRLWRGLLDSWVQRSGDIYIVSPQIDAQRLADVLLVLVKHKLSTSRVHLLTMSRCDLDKPYNKVLREARDVIAELRAPNRNRLVSEERLARAQARLDVRFGRQNSKLTAVCWEERAELLLTSASAHRWHFDLECADTVVHFDMRPSDLVNNYLAPMGLAHQVPLESPTTANSSNSYMNQSLPSTSRDHTGSPLSQSSHTSSP